MEMTENEESPGRYGADYIINLEDMIGVEMTPEQKYIALLAYQAGWVKGVNELLEDRK